MFSLVNVLLLLIDLGRHFEVLLAELELHHCIVIYLENNVRFSTLMHPFDSFFLLGCYFRDLLRKK